MNTSAAIADVQVRGTGPLASSDFATAFVNNFGSIAGGFLALHLCCCQPRSGAGGTGAVCHQRTSDFCAIFWHSADMPTRPSKKKPLDFSQIALEVVEAATQTPLIHKPTDPLKNPAAVALGRLGASKGGKARAEKLSPKKRSLIAKKAARARWSAKP